MFKHATRTLTFAFTLAVLTISTGKVLTPPSAMRINRIWDRRNRARIAVLATAAVLLTYAVVR